MRMSHRACVANRGDHRGVLSTPESIAKIILRALSDYRSVACEMDKCLQQTCHSVQTRLGCRKQFAGSRFLRAPAPQRVHNAKRVCRAGMGLGFTDGLILPRNSEPKLEVPTSSYGLSIRQMAALGLTEDSVVSHWRLTRYNLLQAGSWQLTPVGCPVTSYLVCRSPLLPRLVIAQTRCTRTLE